MSDSPQAVEWPSLPVLPTPQQQPRNSRFQGVLWSFKKVIHPLQRGSHDSSASPWDHPSFELLQPIRQSVESLPLPPLQHLATNGRVKEHTTPRQPDFAQINGLPSVQPTVTAQHASNSTQPQVVLSTRSVRKHRHTRSQAKNWTYLTVKIPLCISIKLVTLFLSIKALDKH